MGLNEIVYVKCLGPCLEHRRGSINGNLYKLHDGISHEILINGKQSSREENWRKSLLEKIILEISTPHITTPILQREFYQKGTA